MEDAPLKDPWLLAAWPGMGHVALGAAIHLRDQIETEVVAELSPSGYFDVTQVAVKDGLIQPTRSPQNTLHIYRNPDPTGRDLLLFVGEAQPATRGYEFCEELMELALSWGVDRVFTFAAMATPSHPKAPARVFGVANQEWLSKDLEPHGVVLLGEGEISGLNGVLLAAATDRGTDAGCLLGEFPYFASGIPNPKASAAVLRAFASLSGLAISCEELDKEARGVEEGLTRLLDRLQQSGPGQLILPQDPTGESEPDFSFDADEDLDREIEETLGDAPDEEPATPRLSPAQRSELEDLFRGARQDRSQAIRLKAELDRLGVFKEYEDRFLDLFKRGE